MNRFDSAVSYLKNIKPTDGVVVVFHNDGDGICSCTLLRKWLAHIGVKPYLISQPMPPDKNLMRRIQSGLPNKIIFLDLAIDQQSSTLMKLKGIADIMIIDHHVVKNDMSKHGIVHYNPRFEKPGAYISNSLVTYKIISKLTSMDEWLWLATLGAVADYDLSASQDLVKETEKRWKMDIFVKIASMLEAARAAKSLTAEQLAERIAKIEKPEQLLEDQDLRLAFQKVQNDIEIALTEAEVAERTGDVIFYKVKSPYNLKSQVSTLMSEKWPDKFIVVYEQIDKYINCSVRNQNKKIGVDRVIRSAVRGIKGATAGGHEAAGAAQMLEKDWQEFKKNVVEIVERLKK